MTDALELDALWDEFRSVVNMTSQELSTWLRVSEADEDTEPLPDQAGDPLGQHVLAILQKRRTDLTDADIQVMYEVVDTVAAQSDIQSDMQSDMDTRARRREPAPPADDPGA